MTLQLVSISLCHFYYLLGLLGPLQPVRCHFPSVWGLKSVDSAAGLLRGGISSVWCRSGRPKTVVARHILNGNRSPIMVEHFCTISTQVNGLSSCYTFCYIFSIIKCSRHQHGSFPFIPSIFSTFVKVNTLTCIWTFTLFHSIQQPVFLPVEHMHMI